MQQSVTFPSGTVNYLFDTSLKDWLDANKDRHIVFITDEHVAETYNEYFTTHPTFVIPAGEQSKQLKTIEPLSEELLRAYADKNTLFIGVGGGVVTDITGFLASIYMRGVHFGFVPTTLLGMVDAAIGGKNGVNIGLHKNILGTITQPEFILYDTGFLNSLPDIEWSNGFAEVIKYACIFDADMFSELNNADLIYYKDNKDALNMLIQTCAAWKNKTVMEDEKEKGVRRLLNFGHTYAHAIENMYELPHGQAVAIGMVAACKLSEEVTGMDKEITEQLKTLLKKFHLPVQIKAEIAEAMKILRMDKKRNEETINYILLESIGSATIHPLPFSVIENTLSKL